MDMPPACRWSFSAPERPTSINSSCSSWTRQSPSRPRPKCPEAIKSDSGVGCRKIADLVPGRERREFLRIVGRRVAAPHDMQIGAQQQKIVAVDRARRLVANIERRDLGAVSRDRLRQRREIRFALADAQDRVAVFRQAILDAGAVVQPDMRQPRARPARWLIGAEEMLRPAGYVGDD